MRNVRRTRCGSLAGGWSSGPSLAQEEIKPFCPRIVGGEKTDIKIYPWQGAFRLQAHVRRLDYRREIEDNLETQTEPGELTEILMSRLSRVLTALTVVATFASWTNVAEAAGKAEVVPNTGHSGFIYGLTFSPDGAQLLSATWDYNLKLWNVATGALIRTLRGHTDRIEAVAFSSDGRSVLSKRA
jgi:WD40 repeat protein